MEFRYLGQSGFSVILGGKHIVFDPFITSNPLANLIDADSIEADYILLSHGHFDHVEDAVQIAKRTGAKVITNPEICNWLAQQGITNLHELNHGAPVPFEFGMVRAVNVIHSSSLPNGSYGGNPMGFVITSNETNFYYSGDTALTMDMQLIPKFTSLAFAILPIGGNYTMDPADAIIASDFIKCNTIIGVHYNTFDFIKIDPLKAIADFAEAGKSLLLPRVGEWLEL